MTTINIRSKLTVDVPEYGKHLRTEEIQEIVRRSGSHFFDKDTMRFFRSRVAPGAYAGPDGWYFITSEQHDREPREYTVRRMAVNDAGDDIELTDVGGFQGYPSLGTARTAAKRAAKAGCPTCPKCRIRLMRSWEGETDICQECADRASK